jgi:catechol 2,3-dioxygenase-like lactoylglutathione lyase family enzyme
MTSSKNMPHAHVSLITLGVTDVPRAARFYEALGFARKMRAAPKHEVAFFDAGTLALSLYAVSGLARDTGFAPGTKPSGFRGASLAWNCGSEAEVDAVMARALTAGATVLVRAKRAAWGGYHGHFADPDGHIWEVAHNPQFPLSAEGRPTLPD